MSDPCAHIIAGMNKKAFTVHPGWALTLSSDAY